MSRGRSLKNRKGVRSVVMHLPQVRPSRANLFLLNRTKIFGSNPVVIILVEGFLS